MEWWQSETEVLKRIVSRKQLLANTIHFALESAFPHPENAFAQDVLVAINVPREDLGFPSGRKPGDIDLLIVPLRGSPMPDRTIEIEAKVVRPTIAMPSRNVNSMGRQQALGLLEDGFPFVGLLHIAIPEPLPEEQHLRLLLCYNELDGAGELKETGEYVSFDPFPLVSARRQEGRLKALDLPAQIAFKAIAFGLNVERNCFEGCNVSEQKFGGANEMPSPALWQAINGYLEDGRGNFQVVQWYVGDHDAAI